MLIDTHVHTSPVSLCSEIRFQEVIDRHIELGYGGLMLTNHYSPWYMDANGLSYEKWLALYLNEYRDAAAYGKRKGFRVFLGAEVTLKKPHYADYLLFGTDEDFFYRHKRLFDLAQSELFALAEHEGLLMVQAHPFRVEQGHTLQDTRFLHGLEINCHANFNNEAARVLETARKENLIITVGGDVHFYSGVGQCGIEVPDDVETPAALAAHLRTAGIPDYRIFSGR